MVCLFYSNKNTITKEGLVCSYYTTFSKNSKRNLPIHEKERNAAYSLFTLSSRSSSRFTLL